MDFAAIEIGSFVEVGDLSSHSTATAEIIPHTWTPHPVTGMANPKFGLWLFLASEVMLFGALFSSYVLLRVGAGDTPPANLPHGLHWESGWPRGYHESHVNVPLATVNTMVLITSSVTVVMAWYYLQLRNIASARKCLWATVACALGFLVIKYFEYSEKIGLGIVPATHNYYGLYYTMTGLHGLHVIGGIVVFLYFLLPGAKMWHTNPQQYTNRIECTGLYWHFVDLVWIFLFPTLYLL